MRSVDTLDAIDLAVRAKVRKPLQDLYDHGKHTDLHVQVGGQFIALWTLSSLNVLWTTLENTEL